VGACGVDIGVKTMAVVADDYGSYKVDGPRLRERFLKKIRALEKTRKYARRQQAKTKRFGKLPKAKQFTNMNRKVKNARADFLHKESTALVEQYETIYFGDVPLKLMNKSKNMAGVSLDHGIGFFKQVTRYKAMGAGGESSDLNEKDSTRTCSVCLTVHPRIGLEVRGWTCGKCKTVHDRDVNAARNILRMGRHAPASRPVKRAA